MGGDSSTLYERTRIPGSIPSASALVAAVLPDSATCVVAALGASRDVAAAPPVRRLIEQGRIAPISLEPFAVAMQDFEMLAAEGVFKGADELWFFDAEPDFADGGYVPPVSAADAERWAGEAFPVVGLGGGDGLDVVSLKGSGFSGLVEAA